MSPLHGSHYPDIESSVGSAGATNDFHASGVTPDGRMVIGAGFASILNAWDAANGEVRAAFGP